MANSNATSPAYTPGPWTATPLNDEEFDVMSDETHIATVYGTGTQSEDGANARLIASAPALLDRCKMHLHDAKDALSGDWIPTAEGWQSIIDDLEEVIAKADRR